MSHLHRGDAPCVQCEMKASGIVVAPGELDPVERRCLENIEKHHCQIWHIDGHVSEFAPSDDGFSYSVGIYASLGAPELIIFGQKRDWRAAMINAIVEKIVRGERYEAGHKYEGLLEGYELSFHSMPAMAYPEYLGWDIWYYRRFFPNVHIFPVLQVVWPDLGGRFPWESGYDNPYKQPILERYNWILDGELVKAEALQ